ncbi:MAG: hypothetical protein COA78_11700 [Blastopirellula sp.]|nr:MAG: hypothetical protein COA78_11700 [Blastopirellula sp.]
MNPITEINPKNTNPKVPVHLGLVITELEIGGAERCVVELATRLDSQYYRVSVVSIASRPQPGKDSLVQRLEKQGITVSFLNCDSRWQIFKAVSKLRHIWKLDPPSLVHSFLFHGNIISSWAMKALPGVKLIHGLRVVEQGRIRRWLQSRYSCKAEKVCCVSEKLAQFASETLKLASPKIEVIPNGINLDQFDLAAELNSDLPDIFIDPMRKVMLCVGRLDIQKGLDWLLKTCPKFMSKLPKWELVFVGEGSERARLLKLAEESEFANAIHFLGQRSDVPRLMKLADLFLLPSRWEGMPNVLLEAMAAKLPVVVTDVEGTRELLGPGSENQLISFGNDQQLADQITLLAGDSELRESLGKSNRARVSDQFSLDQMIYKYDTLYQTCLKSSRQS